MDFPSKIMIYIIIVVLIFVGYQYDKTSDSCKDKEGTLVTGVVWYKCVEPK